MQKYLSKTIIFIFAFSIAIAWRLIFADNSKITLDIANTTAHIIYTPAFATGFFTSGNVSVAITWWDIYGNLNYTITGNWAYDFPYLWGTWPYNSGLAYGPTNLRNTLTITDNITRIDKIPPTFTIVASPSGDSVVIQFSDNSPGVIASINWSPYTSGSAISLAWNYTCMITDVAGNTVSFTFTVTVTTPITPGGWGWGWWGWWGGGWGWGWDEEIVVIPPSTGQVHPAPGISGEIISPYSLELTNAYTWAHTYGITTMPTIQQANLDWYVLRKHLAKMISEFALQFVNMTPDAHRNCIFPDMQTESREMQIYAIQACGLGLMWMEADGTTPKKNFDPNDLVNRAQFGTVFSRLLFGGTYNIKPWEKSVSGTELLRYSKHLQALKEYNIMKQIDDPMMLELRWYVMLMFMRSSTTAIK